MRVLGQKGRAKRCETANRDQPSAGTNTVTYDFKRLIGGAILLECSAFACAIIEYMGILPERTDRR